MWLPVDEAEVDYAAEAARTSFRSRMASFRPMPPAADDLTRLADCVQKLMAQNDPDVVRQGLSQIGATLEALSGRVLRGTEP
jgi:hypothetical protein